MLHFNTDLFLLTSLEAGREWEIRYSCRPGAVAHTFNLSTLGGRDGWIMRSRDGEHPGQHGETPSLLKIQKISWAWWRVPVIPVTQEAEAGELPEPRRRRLQWAEIAPLHPSLGNKSETPSQKKKNSEKQYSSIKYSYAPQNDVSGNDGPHLQWWSHKMTISYFYWTFSICRCV